MEHKFNYLFSWVARSALFTLLLLLSCPSVLLADDDGGRTAGNTRFRSGLSAAAITVSGKVTEEKAGAPPSPCWLRCI